MFADQTEGGRAIEPKLGERGTGLTNEDVQLPIGHDSAFAGEGGLSGIAKHSIEQPGGHLKRSEVTDRAGRNGGVAD